MHVGLGELNKDINIKNAQDILTRGTKEQIVHLFKVYNEIAKKGGAPLLSDDELLTVITSRGLKGFDIDLSSIGDIAGKIVTGLATVAGALGPLVLQKYQIDKLPSVTPASTAVVSQDQPLSTPAMDRVKGGTDWMTIALWGGGALAIGGAAYFYFFKKK